MPNDYLTDIEKEALGAIAVSPVYREALKKLLTYQIINQGMNVKGEVSSMNRNWVFGVDPTNTLSDEEYGRKIRTHAEALIQVEVALKKLDEFAPKEKLEERKNPAK